MDGEQTPAKKPKRQSIAAVIEHRTNVQAEVRKAELDIRRKELELEERRLNLQAENNSALIALLQKMAEKKND